MIKLKSSLNKQLKKSKKVVLTSTKNQNNYKRSKSYNNKVKNYNKKKQKIIEMKKYLKIFYKILIFFHNFRLVLIFLQISLMKIIVKVLKLPNRIFHLGQISYKLNLGIKEVLGLILRIINQKDS